MGSKLHPGCPPAPRIARSSQSHREDIEQNTRGEQDPAREAAPGLAAPRGTAQQVNCGNVDSPIHTNGGFESRRRQRSRMRGQATHFQKHF
jgi:hypothetical protein